MSAFVAATIRAVKVDALRPCSAWRMKQTLRISAARGCSSPAMRAKFAACPSEASGGTGCWPFRRRMYAARIVGIFAVIRAHLGYPASAALSPSASAAVADALEDERRPLIDSHLSL